MTLALDVPGVACAPLDDEAALQDLLERSADAVVAMHHRPPRSDDARALLAAIPPGCTAEDKHVLAVVDGDELIGVVDVVRGYPEPRTYFVGLLLLAPSARGRGLGERIMRALAEAVRSAGGDRLELVVQDTNPGAVRFWTRLGFVPVVPARGGDGERVLGRDLPLAQNACSNRSTRAS